MYNSKYKDCYPYPLNRKSGAFTEREVERIVEKFDKHIIKLMKKEKAVWLTKHIKIIPKPHMLYEKKVRMKEGFKRYLKLNPDLDKLPSRKNDLQL